MTMLLAAMLLQGITPPYTADGSEPFWSLEIRAGRIVYERDGETTSVALPRRRATANGYRYEAAQIIVNIRHEECTDEAATVRTDSVTVTVGNETVDGCGGAVLRSEQEGGAG